MSMPILYKFKQVYFFKNSLSIMQLSGSRSKLISLKVILILDNFMTLKVLAWFRYKSLKSY